jgi:hypothetical protein
MRQNIDGWGLHYHYNNSAVPLELTLLNIPKL